MYNGIGLQTPRGSGTSGYIQSNVSLNQKKPQNREKFLQELQQKRNANTIIPRKANQEIIDHERKRQILIQSMKLRERLQKEGFKEEQIEEKIKRAQHILKNKFDRGELQTKTKDTHVVSQAKDKQYMKLSKAFQLDHNIKLGSAFDFDKLREDRLKKLSERPKTKKFVCEHQDCGKVYDTEQHLSRHLKYKHLKVQEEKL